MASASEVLAELRQYFSYDAERGGFVRTAAKPRGNPKFVGITAGRLSRTGGYLLLRVCGGSHYVHRLVWLWFRGEMPVAQLDHINRDKLDNRIENLRPATGSLNCANRQMGGNLPAGVRFRKGGWEAAIGVGRKRLYLGRFKHQDDAATAYREASMRHFGEFSLFDATI